MKKKVNETEEKRTGVNYFIGIAIGSGLFEWLFILLLNAFLFVIVLLNTNNHTYLLHVLGFFSISILGEFIRFKKK